MVSEFLKSKFLEPMCNYYTPEATATYALILIAAVYAVYRFVKKFEIEIDSKFILGTVPFILYGGTTRALRDHNLYQGYLFCSPPIYFFVFAVASLSLIAGVAIQRKFGIDYYLTMFSVGLSLVVLNSTMITVVNWLAFYSILILTGFWASIVVVLSRLAPEFFTKLNSFILVSHLFDASSTFTALSLFNYCEQHVLPGILTGKYCAASSLPSFLILPFAPWMMFVLKLAAVIPALFIIDKYTEDKSFANFLKLVVLILGLALGTRDFITVAMKPI